MKLLRNIRDWAWGQFIGEVPADDALCEFDCRKLQCAGGEWENCVRRLHRAAGELMPVNEANLEAVADLTPTNAVIRQDFDLI